MNLKPTILLRSALIDIRRDYIGWRIYKASKFNEAQILTCVYALMASEKSNKHQLRNMSKLVMEVCRQEYVCSLIVLDRS